MSFTDNRRSTRCRLLIASSQKMWSRTHKTMFPTKKKLRQFCRKKISPDFLPDFLNPCDIAETGVGYMKRTVPKSRESSGDDGCQTFRIWIKRQNRSEIVEKI